MSKVHEIAFDMIKTAMEKGVVPWRMPWTRGGAWPSNLTTGKPYRGINPMILAGVQAEKGFGSPYWLTARQAGMIGGRVKPEHWKRYAPIFFHKMIDKTDASGKVVDRYPVCMFYQVYNLDQCEVPEEKIPAKPLPAEDPIESAERIVSGMKRRPEIVHGHDRAAYMVVQDRVIMPERGSFDGMDEYYSTLFHELTHSTRHDSRLNREKENYAFEELIAEIGSGMLCNQAGIQPAVVENQAAYIASWLHDLGDNPMWLVQAAGKAQKAVDYILDVSFEEEQAVA